MGRKATATRGMAQTTPEETIDNLNVNPGAARRARILGGETCRLSQNKDGACAIGTEKQLQLNKYTELVKL